jgi:hypothetical protein
MSVGKGKFGTAISCIDGRVHQPIYNFLSAEFGVDYVDIISEPGVDRFAGTVTFESIMSQVMLSINAHKSVVVCISAHYDCAGNPVSKDEHIDMIKRCVSEIKKKKLSVSVVGVWIDDKWQVNVIERT